MRNNNGSFVKMLKYLIVLFFLVALGLNLNLLGVTWASGVEITENILTDVELSVITDFDGDGVPIDFIEISEYIDQEGPLPNPNEDDYDPLPMRIRYDFELPVGHDYKDGDYYEFKLPEVFKVFNEIPSDPPQEGEGELRDGDGTLFGTFTLDLDGNVKITFNDRIEIDGGRETIGWLAFQTELVSEDSTLKTTL